MKISNKFQPHTHTILDQLEMVYYLFQVITQSDLGENYPFNQCYMELSSRPVN